MNDKGPKKVLFEKKTNKLPIEKNSNDIHFMMKDKQQFNALQSSAILFDQLQYVLSEKLFSSLDLVNDEITPMNPYGFGLSRYLPTIGENNSVSTIATRLFLEGKQPFIHKALMEYIGTVQLQKYKYIIIGNSMNDFLSIGHEMKKRMGMKIKEFGFIKKQELLNFIQMEFNKNKMNYRIESVPLRIQQRKMINVSSQKKENEDVIIVGYSERKNKTKKSKVVTHAILSAFTPVSKDLFEIL